MRNFLVLALIGASLFLTGCEAVIADRHYVGHRSGYYGGRYDHDRYDDDRYDDRRYYGSRTYRRSPVVVVNRPAAYYGGTRVVYAHDRRGKYYTRNGKRVYVSVGF